jgi:aspartyl-tRNA(Asn)/glutamyl-tRNA(Gln) amidotransferase subunit A
MSPSTSLPVHARSLAEVSDLIRRREVSPVEVTRDVLDRIAAADPRLNAFITVTAEDALAAARQAEEEIGAGHWRGPMHGIPLSVKDVFDVAGTQTTAASRFLAEVATSGQDAAVVERLRGAGAVVVGKTNLHEFAYGTTSQTSYFGPVRNPWDASRIPGGSSGGSGAAVAAGMGFASIGTDTGGSIRIPAACCGVVGLKPTFGRVSRYGLLPLAPSLDHAGPMTRTVEDGALVLAAIAGHDPRDAASADVPVPPFLDDLEHGARGLRLGVLEARVTEADAEVAAAVRLAVQDLTNAGAEVRTVALELLDAIRAAVVGVLAAEASVTLEHQLREHPDWFGRDVGERLARGQQVLAVDYLRAFELRRAFRREVEQVFEHVDVLVTPMLPVGAPPIGAVSVPINDGTIEVLRATTANTREWNFLGLPAISVPCGLTSAGLPIGLQIVGPAFAEATVLRAARAHERLTVPLRALPPH